MSNLKELDCGYMRRYRNIHSWRKQTNDTGDEARIAGDNSSHPCSPSDWELCNEIF
jgi:hypothetical protein